MVLAWTFVRVVKCEEARPERVGIESGRSVNSVGGEFGSSLTFWMREAISSVSRLRLRIRGVV